MVFFYLKDRYEPEPRGHIAAAFALGALVFLLPFADAHFGLWERAMGREWLALGGTPARLFEAFVMAAGTEEFSKWIIFLTLIYRWQEFDEPFDGVVYAVAVALGFATVENVLYVLRAGATVGLERAVLAVPAHALYGAVMGFYFGRAKLGQVGTRNRRIIWLIFALILPMIFHGSFDFAALVLRGYSMWILAALFSGALWVFVLRRVERAVAESPFKPSGSER